MAFNSSILRNHNGRARMLAVLESALGAVEPARLTAAALERLPIGDQPATVVAIGKAAPAMAGGAADTLGPVRAGLIVTDHPEDAPPGFEQMIGGHPLPDGRSLRAAEG